MSDAYGAARELLERAEQDAARIRADADRYLRQREQEAELLVAKARRLLAVAEQRAASLAMAPVPRPVTVGAATEERIVEGRVGAVAVGVAEAPQLIDLDAYERSLREGGGPIVPTGLDRMLQMAISKAVDRSFHLGR